MCVGLVPSSCPPIPHPPPPLLPTPLLSVVAAQRRVIATLVVGLTNQWVGPQSLIAASVAVRTFVSYELTPKAKRTSTHSSADQHSSMLSLGPFSFRRSCFFPGARRGAWRPAWRNLGRGHVASREQGTRGSLLVFRVALDFMHSELTPNCAVTARFGISRICGPLQPPTRNHPGRWVGADCYVLGSRSLQLTRSAAVCHRSRVQ